jgi:UDP:flavonoid glycosyltransferase YjiC (YdhE family)
MGSSLGHLTNLKPFVDAALELGHEVSLAVREQRNVATLFDVTKIQLLPAPFPPQVSHTSSSPLISFSQLINRQMFSNEKELNALYNAWDSLFDLIKPDLVVYDHSPSALVASVDKPWQKWVVGSGFLVPRSDGPFLGAFPGLKPSLKRDRLLEKEEKNLLVTINQVLSNAQVKPLKSVKHLYQQCDQQLLLTLPELDHFGARPKGKYLGVKWSDSGVEPFWPEGGGPKVFVYLHPFPNMAELFNTLLKKNARILFYARDLPEALKQKLKERIAFSDHPINLTQAYTEADYVINHANHGTVTQAVGSGVPQLLIPMHQEQLLLAQRVVQLGMGVIAFRDQPEFLSSWQKLTSITKRSRVNKTHCKPKQDIKHEISRLMQKTFPLFK